MVATIFVRALGADVIIVIPNPSLAILVFQSSVVIVASNVG